MNEKRNVDSIVQYVASMHYLFFFDDTYLTQGPLSPNSHTNLTEEVAVQRIKIVAEAKSQYLGKFHALFAIHDELM